MMHKRRFLSFQLLPFLMMITTLLTRSSTTLAKKIPSAFVSSSARRASTTSLIRAIRPAFSTTTASININPLWNSNSDRSRQLHQSTTVLSAAKHTTPKPPSTPYRLVIVESPSKCKTIEKILNDYVKANDLDYDFVVTSCYGHIRNLPKNNQQLREAKYISGPAETSTPTQFPYSIVGVDLNQGYQPTYVLLDGKEKLVKDLQALTDAAQHVYLATDPDREGEAIAWHLQEVLQLKNNVERLSFTEITPAAIQTAVQHPTCLNDNLVQAQETRRILDRLAGFTVSPILWKKIAPGLSAGRVQSVGMAMCVQRERERLVFQPTGYWDVQGNFSTDNGILKEDFIQATLATINGTSLVAGKTDLIDNEETGKPQPKPNKRLLTQSDAESLVARLQQEDTTEWQITSVTGRERMSYPPDPFKTSTLQQESNQRLGMSVAQTMRSAQQLYEAGWISYMRTDATHLSDDAHAGTLQAVTQRHGPQYVGVPKNSKETKRKGSKKKKEEDQADKVAQEAHEAIRPAIRPDGGFADPTEVARALPSVAPLYELIFQRTLASRMLPQKTNQTTVVLEGSTQEGDVADFRATGSVVLEPGYTLEWSRGSGDGNRALPPLQEGQDLSCHDLEPQSHTTQPPARYTEASLVKELEARGVGRPSTYAGIVQILRDRAYVGSPTSVTESSRNNRKEASGAMITAQRAAGGGDLFGARGPLAPSLSAFVVTSLLEEHCPTYVDPSFTAQMEENLDRIANGSYDGEDEGDSEMDAVAKQRVAYLNEFYAGDQGLAAKVKKIDEQVQAEDARRANLPALEMDSSSDEDIGIYIGPWGPYIQQKDGKKEPVKANLPPGMATDLSTITPGTLKVLVKNKQDGTILGQHPDDGKNIYLRVGRFGAYLQWGETDEEGTSTHSLPKHMSAMRDLQLPSVSQPDQAEDADDTPTESSDDSASLEGMIGITLEEAIGYCGLPRTVCMYNETEITAAIGPYGPYLKYDNKYTTLHARDGDVLTVDEETATQLVIDGIINKKSGPGRGVLAELGEMDGSKVTIKSGRFGSYINWKKVNAKLPPQYVDEPETMPLDEAWSLIEEKAGQPPRAKKGSSKSKDSDLPPAPKRPKSAYMYFCSDKRPEVAGNGKSLGDVTKEIASMWADVSDEDRKQYDDLAEAGKGDYQKEKAAWEEECKKLQGGKSKKKSSSAASGPKRGRSAYIFFCGAKRPEVSQRLTKLGDISKELARMWADTTDREEYTAMAEADKARYEAEMVEVRKGTWSPTTEATGAVDSKVKGETKRLRVVNGNKKSTRKAKTSTKKKTTKRAPSAYMIFCRETRGEIVDENGEKLPLGETTKRLAKLWKEIDIGSRAKFHAMAAEEKEKLLVAS